MFVNHSQKLSVIKKFYYWHSKYKTALLTLVKIHGSSPYPVGTQMIINEFGETYGQIFNGCIEDTLVTEVKKYLTLNISKVVSFGDGQPFFDIHLPCGSKIDIFIDTKFHPTLLEEIINKLDDRISVTLITNLKTAEKNIGPLSNFSYLNNDVFISSFLPMTKLIIIGEGNIVTELTLLALNCGFDIVIYTNSKHTERQLKQVNLTANPLTNMDKDQHLLYDENSAFISLFHNHEIENELLKNILDKKLMYIGALGSSGTHKKRVEQLKEARLDKKLIDRIHGPIGLDINARSPNEIAISILAEVVLKLNEKYQ